MRFSRYTAVNYSCAGNRGMTLFHASNYNRIPRPAVVMVRDGRQGNYTQENMRDLLHNDL